MNERIKELAEQADWWKPLGLPSNWDEGDYVVSPEQMKKFAELIVKKCAMIADYAHLGGVIEPGVMVKEYFGVE